jgi:hypothetical protein
MKTILILLTAALSLTMSAWAGQAPTLITAPRIITVPGSYILANDIIGTTPGIVIEIQASNVTLNLNGHTITATLATGISIDQYVGNNTGNATLVIAHVSNGKIVAAGGGLGMSGSYCLINGLNITVGASGVPISIEHGNFNRVQDCVLSSTGGPTSMASHNTIHRHLGGYHPRG